MLESKLTIPHFYLASDFDMSRVVRVRSRINAETEAKLSFNDFIVKACAHTLKNHPECNVSYANGKIRYYNAVHVSIAVTIPGGLLTPTIKDCEKKSLFEISEEAKILIEKARNKRLRPREGMGGTITVSNLGMYDVEEFSAIVNPPQALIVAVGSIREIPVVEDGGIVIGKRMKVTLSCDHRLIDGTTGAVFLSELKKGLEHPEEYIL